MPVTLGALMARTEFRLSWVTTPGAERRVVWAHPIELLDPTPWLTGGELILTTGLRMPRSAAGQRAYVERLAAVEAAGIAFGVGLSHAAVPPDIRDAGQELGLPIIEVPFEVPFIAITRWVASAQAAEQERTLRQTLAHHQTLTRAASTTDVRAVVRQLAKALTAEVALADRNGELLSVQPKNAAFVPRRATETAQHMDTARLPFSSMQQIEGVHLIELSVGQGQQTRLLAVCREQPFSEYDRLLVQQLASLLHLLHEGRGRWVTDRFRVATNVFADLRRGPASPSAELIEATLAIKPGTRLIAANLRDKVAAMTRRALFDALLDEGIMSMLGDDGHGGLLMVVSATEDVRRQALAIVRQSVSASAPMGLSDPVTAADLASAIRQATHVAQIAAVRQATELTFQGVGLHSYLLGERTAGERRLMAEQVLGPVLALRPATATRLLHSLSAFLHCNGHWGQAADRAAVHRHTLRQHLEQVEALTGRSLQDAYHRSDLFLAITALEL